jgi:hypothetical protein
MLQLQTGLLALAGVIAIAFGIKYMLAREFMAYHATVAGRTWAELQSGVQAIILGMYTIMGGGFITYGATLLWLLVPLSDGQRWAAWAVLTLTITSLVPVLYVTVWLRGIQPDAKTPVLPAAIVIALALVGGALSLVPR